MRFFQKTTCVIIFVPAFESELAIRSGNFPGGKTPAGIEINAPIRCGGITVRPGDLIFADVDGTVVVPQEVADEAISKAWEKVKGENKVRDALRSGAGVTETFAKYGIL